MSFLKDSSRVLTGITIQRVLSCLMIPIIARLIGPKDYGIFNVAMSFCMLIVIIGSFALEASIAVSETQKTAAERTIGTSLMGIGSGFFCWIILYLIQPYLKSFYSIDIINALVLMIPIYVPLTIISISFQNYIGYLGRFQFFAIADITYPIANFGTLLFIYIVFWKDYRSLIAAGIMATLVRVIIFVYAAKNSRLLSAKVFSVQIFKSLWQARNFAKFNFPSNILNVATVQLPPILLSMAFSESVIGLFSMARNIITIPTSLSGRALGQVFYPRAALNYRETGSIKKITWQTFLYSCQLVLFPAIFTAAVASFVLPVLLGHKWDGVATFIVLLLPLVLINAVQTQIGIGFVFSILNQQYKILIGNMLLFICRILPLVVFLIIVRSPHLTILAYSVGSAVGYAILLAWIFTSTSIQISKAFYTWVKYCLISGLCVLPIVGAKLKGGVILLTFSLTTSIIIYGFIAWFTFLNIEQRSLVIYKIKEMISPQKKNSNVVEGPFAS